MFDLRFRIVDRLSIRYRSDCTAFAKRDCHYQQRRGITSRREQNYAETTPSSALQIFLRKRFTTERKLFLHAELPLE